MNNNEVLPAVRADFPSLTDRQLEVEIANGTPGALTERALRDTIKRTGDTREQADARFNYLLGKGPKPKAGRGWT